MRLLEESYPEGEAFLTGAQNVPPSHPRGPYFIMVLGIHHRLSGPIPGSWMESYAELKRVLRDHLVLQSYFKDEEIEAQGGEGNHLRVTL